MEARVLLTGAQYQALASLLATVKKDSSVDVALRHSDESQDVDVTVYFSLGREANIWRIESNGYTRDMGELVPRCKRCGNPETWHSEDDGQCPDDDCPRPDSEAGYNVRMQFQGGSFVERTGSLRDPFVGR